MTMLQPNKWDALSSVEKLLSKFAKFTNIAGGEEYPTLSMVIPYYLELQYHLEDMIKDEPVAGVARLLLNELHRCFGNLFDSKQKGHNPIYIIATLLDPRYKMLLGSEHVAYARKECLKCLNGDLESSDEDAANGHGVSAVLQSPGPSDGDTSMMEPPHKQPRKESNQLSYIDRVLQQKATEKKTAQRNPKLPEIQLDGCTNGVIIKEDPITFWLKYSHTILAPFAIDILLAPSSSAAVERTFSTAGEATIGRRNQLMKENLEKEVLLKKRTKSITLL